MTPIIVRKLFEKTSFVYDQLKSRPFENSLVDFCISALLKALKINLLYPKKANGQAFRSAEVQKSARKFSHSLD